MSQGKLKQCQIDSSSFIYSCFLVFYTWPGAKSRDYEVMAGQEDKGIQEIS
jgi:hypothetical protein